tara:strand:- start:1309 stop:2322 length:1014 start_codon:yes stop_codon:yes gene_type:complete
MKLDLLPGIVLMVLVAALARILSGLLPSALSEVFVALALGLALANLIGSSEVFKKFASSASSGSKLILQLGIVALGARLSFSAVVDVGMQSILFILICFFFALTFTLLVASKLGLTRNLSVLLALGTAVCGNSAIMAASPLLKAKPAEVAYAVASTTLFGTLAVLSYPVVGQWLALSQTEFGVWAGTAVNDTAQVVATGFSFGDEAGDTATIVKLTRNLLIGPVLLVTTWWSVSRIGQAEPSNSTGLRRILPKAVPPFVIGFLILAVLKSAGVISDDLSTYFGSVGTFLISMAVAGIGLGIDVRGLFSIGARPLITGFASSIALALLSISLVTLFWA